MKFNAKQIDLKVPSADCLVVPVFSDGALSSIAKQVDQLSGGFLTKLIEQGDFVGNCAEVVLLHHVPNIQSRVLLLGCGKKEEFNEATFRKVITQSVLTLKPIAAKTVVYYLEDLPLKHDIFWKIRVAIEILADKTYVFDQFKNKKTPVLRALQDIIFNVTAAENIDRAQQKIKEGQAIINGIKFTKDLGNLPPNICTPTYMAEQAEMLAKNYNNLSAQILNENQLRELGMGSLLAVTYGSHQPPKLIVLEYYGAEKNKKPIVLVGKGVTFDTGGISLKPGVGMDEMKFDMCGAASVFGAIKAAAELQLPMNIIGIVPAVENMPGGKATRPGDIVTSMSGQTVEILNTDAEGRLILCDALTYSEKYDPDCVIDIATLTGAMIITLGAVASGLMSNHDPLVKELQKAAVNSGEKIWELPIWDDYQDLLNSPFADMANIGEGMGAKSIVAGCFLARFAKKFHWAHLDIAGTASVGGKEKSATGRPVSLLVQFLLDRSVA